ncbi:MAG: pantetheine-phosphate adenylyltransferase [Parachlamydiales bacterium]|nr:pantetheine-phosphate adenylyltransferase [Parachlamydiales bacterium]
MKIAVFPGTFDPPTLGHLDIIERSLNVADQLIIAVADHYKNRTPLFSVHERLELLKKLTSKHKNIEVVSFDGLLIDCIESTRAHYIIRGLRAFSDVEYEFRMALTNRKMGDIETIFLMAGEGLAHISSSLIREIGGHGRHLLEFLPKEIEQTVFERLSNRK